MLLNWQRVARTSRSLELHVRGQERRNVPPPQPQDDGCRQPAKKSSDFHVAATTAESGPPAVVQVVEKHARPRT